MCGRYTLTADGPELAEAFDLPALTFDWAPRYNIAPGQAAPVLGQDARGRRMGLMRWGFVPARAASRGRPFINARAETVAAKASFREAFARRRCLVPADGFYEWAVAADGKVPHWIRPTRGGVLTFAGIWERWTEPGGDAEHGFAILTTDSNAEVATVHDRMPVIVEEGAREAWLDRSTPRSRLRDLLRPAPDGSFALRVVDRRVNAPANDDPSLIEPAG